MEFEVFRVERRDAVAVVWMNRPEKKNAMSPTFFRELPLVLAELGADPDVRRARPHRRRRRLLRRRRHRLVPRAPRPARLPAAPAARLRRLPRHRAGRAAGRGGRERHRLRRRHRGHPALRHRHRLRARDLRVPRGDGGAPAGLRPGAGPRRDRTPLDALARAHGRHHRRRARRSRSGSSRPSCRTTSCSTRPSRIAGRIAANPAIAVRVGKQFVNRDTGLGLAETLETTALLFTTADHKEGVAAFLERRPPSFEGR